MALTLEQQKRRDGYAKMTRAERRAYDAETRRQQEEEA